MTDSLEASKSQAAARNPQVQFCHCSGTSPRQQVEQHEGRGYTSWVLEWQGGSDKDSQGGARAWAGEGLRQLLIH